MWFSVVYSFIDNDTRHHSGQNVVDSRGTAKWVRNKFWPLWWRVSLSIKLFTTLNHFRFVFYHNIKVTEPFIVFFFFFHIFISIQAYIISKDKAKN